MTGDAFGYYYEVVSSSEEKEDEAGEVTTSMTTKEAAMRSIVRDFAENGPDELMLIGALYSDRVLQYEDYEDLSLRTRTSTERRLRLWALLVRRPWSDMHKVQSALYELGHPYAKTWAVFVDKYNGRVEEAPAADHMDSSMWFNKRALVDNLHVTPLFLAHLLLHDLMETDSVYALFTPGMTDSNRAASLLHHLSTIADGCVRCQTARSVRSHLRAALIATNQAHCLPFVGPCD